MPDSSDSVLCGLAPLLRLGSSLTQPRHRLPHSSRCCSARVSLPSAHTTLHQRVHGGATKICFSSCSVQLTPHPPSSSSRGRWRRGGEERVQASNGRANANLDKATHSSDSEQPQPLSRRADQCRAEPRVLTHGSRLMNACRSNPILSSRHILTLDSLQPDVDLAGPLAFSERWTQDDQSRAATAGSSQQEPSVHSRIRLESSCIQDIFPPHHPAMSMSTPPRPAKAASASASPAAAAASPSAFHRLSQDTADASDDDSQMSDDPRRSSTYLGVNARTGEPVDLATLRTKVKVCMAFRPPHLEMEIPRSSLVSL